MDIEGANSDLELANNALLKVGHRAILSFDQENSKAARCVRANFELTRAALLEGYSWNFSSAFIEIAISLNVGDHPKYAYAYKLPTDCLDVRSLVDVDDYDWELHGGYIWCDHGGSLTINYTSYADDVPQYGALFRQLLIARLAVVFAQIPGSVKLSREYMAQAEAWEIEAKKIDGTTGNKQPVKKRRGRYSRARGRRY